MKVKCNTCNGTGIFKHWTCAPDEAQECATCKGLGYQEIKVEPFFKKEKVNGINTVVTDAFGAFNQGKTRISYEEFLKK